MKKISIVTVTYNCVDTIEKSIRSVIDQNYGNIEYIICDGASNDGTKEIIERYREYIDWYVSEPDSGIYNAMNKALDHVTGDIVEFLNGDDFFADNEVISRVEREFSDHLDLDILVGKDALNIVSGIHYPNRFLNVYVDAIFPHQALFAKTYIFDRIGKFNENYRICADRDWILKAWSENYKFLLKDDIYVHFSPGGGSFGRDTPLEEYLIAVKYLKKTGQDKYLKYAERRCNQHFANWYVGHIFEKDKYMDLQKNIWREALSKSNECIVWGQGKYGTLFIKSLICCGYSIKFIIDQSMKMNDQKIEVYQYCKERIGVPVVISASEYDEEICGIIKKDGISDDMIVSFDKIRKYMFKYIDKNNQIRESFKNITNLELWY